MEFKTNRTRRPVTCKILSWEDNFARGNVGVYEIRPSKIIEGLFCLTVWAPDLNTKFWAKKKHEAKWLAQLVEEYLWKHIYGHEGR